MNKEKKQAILILAHDNLYTLKKIIMSLDSKYFDLYIHVDKKSNICFADVKDLCKMSTLYFYKVIDVRWADFSQVEAELFLLSKSVMKEYEYYHLISGNDMPLKRPKDIYDFFHGSKLEYVHFSSKETERSKIDWVKYYHLFMKKIRNNLFLNVLDKFLVLLQKVVFVNRLRNKNIKIMSGANWFSITNELANYTIQNADFIRKTYRYTRSPDEIFLQTLIENSVFKEHLYNKEYNDNYDSCKRLIKWDGKKPYVFKSDDYDELDNSSMFFARKFDENEDGMIIDLLYKRLRG